MMIFANYIMTSSKGPDFSSVSSALTPDQFVCAWFTGNAASCSKVYTLNSDGRVAINGTQVSVEDAENIFAKHLMPMNSRLSNEAKLDLFRTYFLALKYVGTIFSNTSKIQELNDSLLKTAYLVFDGINRNKNAVSIVDTFDASAHTVSVLENGSMETKPYLNKLSNLTDLISLNVATPANVEKVLIKIEGYAHEKVSDNAMVYYKPTGNLKEEAIILTPGNLEAGTKALKELIGPNNVDELGDIVGKMTVVVNSKISGKSYSTQKTYEFLVNETAEGVDTKPVPSNISIFLADSTGHQLPVNSNPGIILNPGNRVLYPNESGNIDITGLAPAAYTVNAFADGYYTKTVNINVPEKSTFGVEIRLDEEKPLTAYATLTVKVKIDTAKHPGKVYLRIYDEDMVLVANGAADTFNETSRTYSNVNIENLPSGRYTLLATGEEMYNYIEEITVYEGNNEKEITVVAKNACGNGIIDSGEECEVISSASVRCGDIYPASTSPEATTTCDTATCLYNKTDCGKRALCGDGIIDTGEICDTKSRNCSEILGENTSGIAPCDNCERWVTEGNCSRTAACENIPANAVWIYGTFSQVRDGNDWTPATKTATTDTTQNECVFSCKKGYKWDGTKCTDDPLSLGNICTGQTICFNGTELLDECPAYGTDFFGQDPQYAETGFCTQKSFSTTGSGNEIIVVDNFTRLKWQKVVSPAKNWNDANQFCSQSNYGNSSGSIIWKLPTPAELLTIVDGNNAYPALVSEFDRNGGNTFWSTADARNDGNAWMLGENGEIKSVSKSTENFVLCVSKGNYDPVTPRFEIADKTVTDKESSLMWQKSYSSSKSWREALNYCEEISTDGYYDWRLPNRNELASLIDFEKTSGTASEFSGLPANRFWTSTTSTGSMDKALTADFATGAVESASKTSFKYVVCVRNTGECFGEECADPCGFNPCRNIENSTGLCSAENGTFTCGCKSGFKWDSGKCLLNTTRYVACEGLPDNAHWNTVFGISQTLNSDGEWTPSSQGSYDVDPSSTRCRYVCNTNYEWTDGRCNAQSRRQPCKNKPVDYTVWNKVNEIWQTWNGDAWEPSENASYNEEESTEECRFKCKNEHFKWNREHEKCDPDKRDNVPCSTDVENIVWGNNKNTVNQTWDDSCGSEGCWRPTEIGEYRADIAPDPNYNACFFKCIDNYVWNEGNRECKHGEHRVDCVLPSNAEFNTLQTINQTWNGEAWEPSNIAVYSEESSTSECRYKCKSGFMHRDDDQDGCVQNPCSSNPCASIPNTTSGCTPSSWDTYSCECAKGYFLLNSQCVTSGRICTGESKCYNNSAEITCPASESADFYGQDWQYAEAGYCTPISFTLNTNNEGNTVTDNNTGLTWPQEPPEETAADWDAAKTYCKNLQYAGYSDWRLPTAKELQTIVDYSKLNPAMDTDYFTAIDKWVWTSQEYKGDQQKAWLINFYYGDATTRSKTDGSSYAFCVRGSELPENGNFELSQDEEFVTDTATGLIWQNGYAADKTWEAALEYCENLEYAGYSDWRLPNINELISLINYDAYSPASSFPGVMPSQKFWSSSTGSDGAQYAWYADFETGGTFDPFKTNKYYVRCVRTGLGCEYGTFWNGTECVDSPCESDPCPESSTGECFATAWDKYTCGCADGYFWSGTDCVDPCENDPCPESSTGECFASAWDKYTCGCDDGAFWDGEKCDERKPSGRICTGLSGCYDSTAAMTCATPGEDFFGQDAQYKAVVCTPKSFTSRPNNGNETVFDNNTKLEWLKNISSKSYTWAGAVSYCSNLTYAGYDDWRLPTAKELQTILDYGRYNPAVDTNYFNVSSSYIWTSQEYKGDSQNALYVNSYEGNTNISAKNTTFLALCVRGSELPETTSDQFEISALEGDEIVTDTETGLIWQNGYAAYKTWQEALKYCENLEYAGYSDWRLPNINELISLINYEAYSPASSFPGVMPSQKFWSSSTGSDGAQYAWYADFETGKTWDLLKTNKYYVRCVRTDICEEDEFWNGTECVQNPCGAYSCNGAAHSVCIPKSADDFICSCDNADSGYFWSGTACVNPCDSHTCGSHSTGGCTPTSVNTFVCGCDDGYFWHETSCVNPCDSNPCAPLETCTPKAWNDYECSTHSCSSGYFWNGTDCIKSKNLGKLCTGQNKCHNNGNDPITCPSSSSADFFGQDAQYTNKCYAKNFILVDTGVSGENTVLDNNTGLEWQQTIPSNGYTWANAKNYCSNLSYGTYDDWRLPTPKELFTIINDSRYAPATYNDYFTNTASDANYWTSKKFAVNTSQAWTVVIRWGYTSSQSESSSQTAEGSEPIKVRCVRGATLPEANFSSSTVNGDVIVNDSSTGLIWTKTYVTGKKWQEALKYCEDLTYAGKSDWRLPNKNELISIINYDKSSPASDFPDIPSRRFWVSTSRPNLPERAFDLDLSSGGVSTYHKVNYTRAVICVRN